MYNECKNDWEKNQEDSEKRKKIKERETEKTKGLALAKEQKEKLRTQIKERKLAENIAASIDKLSTNEKSNVL